MRMVSAWSSNIETVSTLKSSTTLKMSKFKKSGSDTWSSLNRTVFIISFRFLKKLGPAISHQSIVGSKRKQIKKLLSKSLKSSSYRKMKKKLSSSKKVFCSCVTILILYGIITISTRKLESTLWLSYWPKEIYSSIRKSSHFYRSINQPSFSSN